MKNVSNREQDEFHKIHLCLPVITKFLSRFFSIYNDFHSFSLQYDKRIL